MNQMEENKFSFNPIENYHKLKKSKTLLLVVFLATGLALLALSFVYREYDRLIRDKVWQRSSSQFQNRKIFALNIPISTTGGGPNSSLVAGRIITVKNGVEIDPNDILDGEIFWTEPIKSNDINTTWLIFSEYDVSKNAIGQVKTFNTKFILDKIKYKSVRQESESLYNLAISISIFTK